MRTLAGAGGWDLGTIPDGLDVTKMRTSREIIGRGIDGQWGLWDGEQKRTRLRHLAEVLLRSRRGNDVQPAILKNGFRFENGDFVPVDATGQIPR